METKATTLSPGDFAKEDCSANVRTFSPLVIMAA